MTTYADFLTAKAQVATESGIPTVRRMRHRPRPGRQCGTNDSGRGAWHEGYVAACEHYAIPGGISDETPISPYESGGDR